MASQDLGYDAWSRVDRVGPFTAYDDTLDMSVRRRRPRVSFSATLGLIVSLIALCATLSGLLAPVGFAVGVPGVLFSIAGMIAASRAHVTGRILAILGVLVGLTAIVLSALAMTGRYAWPNSDIDEVARVHQWLVDRWPWLDQ
jgi:hypothetical protein